MRFSTGTWTYRELVNLLKFVGTDLEGEDPPQLEVTNAPQEGRCALPSLTRALAS